MIIRVFGKSAKNALCIASNESHFNPQAVNTKKNKPVGSRDRGVFQINSYWHAEVSDAQAFDPLQNVQAAYRIYRQDGNWHEWTTASLCGL